MKTSAGETIATFILIFMVVGIIWTLVEVIDDNPDNLAIFAPRGAEDVTTLSNGQVTYMLDEKCYILSWYDGRGPSIEPCFD